MTCTICSEELRPDGYCENAACPEYTRTLLHDNRQGQDDEEAGEDD